MQLYSSALVRSYGIEHEQRLSIAFYSGCALLQELKPDLPSAGVGLVSEPSPPLTQPPPALVVAAPAATAGASLAPSSDLVLVPKSLLCLLLQMLVAQQPAGATLPNRTALLYARRRFSLQSHLGSTEHETDNQMRRSQLNLSRLFTVS